MDMENNTTFLAKQIGRYFQKKMRNKQRQQKFSKGDKTKNKVVCYNCNKPGHFQNECPNNDSDKKDSRSKHKKAMIDAWGNNDNESESDEKN